MEAHLTMVPRSLCHRHRVRNVFDRGQFDQEVIKMLQSVGFEARKQEAQSNH